MEEHPKNYWGLQSLATLLFQAKKYDDAIKHLETIRTLSAVSGERGGPLEMLAMAYQESGDAEKEKEVLLQIIAQSSDALPALQRLIEMETAQENWQNVATYAESVLAIQPLLPAGHESLADASEALDAPARLIAPLKALLALDPIDPAGVHFRLAKALASTRQDTAAKRHVLMALEDAPRYRQAHALLLELVEAAPSEESE